MINETALRDALLALTQDGRSTYVLLSSVLAEVAALRETVRGLDPTFADVLKEKRSEMAQKNSPIVRDVIRSYDEILARLNAGEIC